MVLHPPTCLCFCVLLASALPPTCSCFVFYTQNLSAYWKAQMLGTAVRALTDPASLSKDASVSNEDLQEIALEAQVNSLFDGSSDSDSECVQRPVVLAPGNTKDQQNEQPKAGCSSGTSSLCPLDLIDEDIDHNQNDSEEEQIDEVGSPSPASSALKRFGSASNQQIRGNLEQAVTRMYAECELEKESGHAQQVWRYTTRRKGDISPAHKAARCAVLDAMCSRGCLLRCELSKIYQLSFKTYMADRLAENIELERCPQTCPDGSMSRVLPKLMTAFGFVRVDVFLPDGKQLRKHHLGLRLPRSRWVLVLGLRLCPVFCLINTPPPACVFVFCLHRHSPPPARVLCLVRFPGPPHGKKMRPCGAHPRTLRFHVPCLPCDRTPFDWAQMHRLQLKSRGYLGVLLALFR